MVAVGLILHGVAVVVLVIVALSKKLVISVDKFYWEPSKLVRWVTLFTYLLLSAGLYFIGALAKTILGP